MQQKNNDFEFKYSAPTAEERREIESIRRNYINKEKTKIDELRALDNRVKNIPTIISLVVGIVGILVFGLGMTMVLYWNVIIWGVVVGILGVVPMILSYPSYVKISVKMKVKYSDKILKLSDELLNEEEK